MNSQDIQQYGSTGYGCQSGLWSGKQGKYIFPCPCSHLRIWSRETVPAVPSRVNTLILNAQAGYVSRFITIPRRSQLGLYPFCFFLFFSCFFFLRIAGVAQAIMLWHIMLLFGDAFGPAYYFLVFLHPIMLFFGGVQLQKCFQQAITLLYGRFRRSQQCCVQRMCVCMHVCMVITYSRVWINRIRLAILLVVS